MTDEGSCQEIQVDSGMADASISVKFQEFRQLEFMCDTLIIAKDDKKYRAHKMVLASRSDYFYETLMSSFKEVEQSVINLQESGEIIEEILQYVYTGRVNFTGDKEIELLRVADQYRFPALFRAVEEHIINSISVENCIDLLKTSRSLKAARLERRSWVFLYNNLSDVPKFEELDKADVIKLCKKGAALGSFVSKFLAWFSASHDVETATEVLKNLNFKKLDKNVIAQMKLVFAAAAAPCVSVILQKMIDLCYPVTVSNDLSVRRGTTSTQLTEFCHATILISSEDTSLHSKFPRTAGLFYLTRVNDSLVGLTKKGGDRKQRNYLIYIYQKSKRTSSYSYKLVEFGRGIQTCELRVRGNFNKHWTIFVCRCLNIHSNPAALLDQRNGILQDGTGESFAIDMLPAKVLTTNDDFLIKWETQDNTMVVKKLKPEISGYYAVVVSRVLETSTALVHLHECYFTTGAVEEVTFSFVFGDMKLCYIDILMLQSA